MNESNRTRPLGIFFILILLPNTWAQTGQVRFERISLEDGLSQSTVFCLLQDSRGLMWFGTANGLNQYNGHEFTVYHHDPNDPNSLPSDEINCLYQDSQDRLWIGTNNGLCRLDDDTPGYEKFKRFPLPTTHVRSIFQDASGTIWFGSNYGLHRFNEDTQDFVHYSTNPNSNLGLSSRRVSSIIEDRDGELWLGTLGGGVTRFNPKRNQMRYYLDQGRQWSPIYSEPLHTSIERLMQEKPLAAISMPGNLVDLRKSFQVEQPTRVVMVQLGEYAPEPYDHAWIEGREGRLPLMNMSHSRHGGGALRNRLLVETATLQPGQYQLCFRSDERHSFGSWVSLPPRFPKWWGVHVFAVDEALAQRIQLESKEIIKPSQLLGNLVSHIIEDRSGNIWIGTEKALNRFEKATQTFTHYQYREGDPNTLPPGVRSICEDGEGQLWVGTAAGLACLNPETGTIRTYRHDARRMDSLSSDRVRSLTLDRTGTLWIGTVLGGLSTYHPQKNRFQKLAHNPYDEASLIDQLVYAFYEDQEGYLYIGGRKGLTVLDPNSDTLRRLDEKHPIQKALRFTDIMAICEDTKGRMWIGINGGGLIRLPTPKPGSKIPVWGSGDGDLKHYGQHSQHGLRGVSVRALLKDSSDTLWVGTVDGGLNRYDPDLDRFDSWSPGGQLNNAISGGGIRSIYEEKPGVLWLGMVHTGLDRFDVVSNRFQNWRNDPEDPHSLSHNVVTSVYKDSHHRVWVATYGGGFNLLNEQTNRFTRFTEAEGLPNNVIYGILPDHKEHLWLSHNKGLSVFDPSTNSFKHYDVDDGLQSNEFNTGAYLRLRNGSLAFGGVNGANLVDPKTLRDNLIPPPVEITAVRVLGEVLPLSQQAILLDHDRNFISFDFGAFDYLNPEKNRFAYKLEGLENQWRESGGRRYADYTNIDPGSYTFRVKGSNSDGVWNEEGASFSFTIAHPFWQTWWFLSLILLLAIALIILLLRLRLRGLEREKAMQESFSKRLIQSQEQERKRIAAELHDSLGQNLLVVNNEIQHKANQLRKQYNDHGFDELAGMILDSINEVRDIAYDLHPHQLERLGLKKAIASVVNKVSLATEVDLELRNDEVDGIFAKDVEINIYRIIQEAVNNIVKHSCANHAEIRIYREEKQIRIEIEDDGIGFDFKRVARVGSEEQGIGLSGMMERAKLIGGQLRLRTEPAEGTHMTLKIPIKEQ